MKKDFPFASSRETICYALQRSARAASVPKESWDFTASTSIISVDSAAGKSAVDAKLVVLSYFGEGAQVLDCLKLAEMTLADCLVRTEYNDLNLRDVLNAEKGKIADRACSVQSISISRNPILIVKVVLCAGCALGKAITLARRHDVISRCTKDPKRILSGQERFLTDLRMCLEKRTVAYTECYATAGSQFYTNYGQDIPAFPEIKTVTHCLNSKHFDFSIAALDPKPEQARDEAFNQMIADYDGCVALIPNFDVERVWSCLDYGTTSYLNCVLNKGPYEDPSLATLYGCFRRLVDESNVRHKDEESGPKLQALQELNYSMCLKGIEQVSDESQVARVIKLGKCFEKAIQFTQDKTQCGAAQKSYLFES
jgi:hypothetical protein